jgi:hypothetical protein
MQEQQRKVDGEQNRQQIQALAPFLLQYTTGKEVIPSQERINEKTVALTMRGARLTGRMLAKALSKLLREMKKQKQKTATKTYRGKQTVKQLIRQGEGVSDIPITDGNIKSFEGIARKYGVDFALKKDSSVTPPKWHVFFKGKDADALTAAFSEFTAKTLNRSADKPSVLTLLQKMKELVKLPIVDKTRAKTQEGPTL